MLTVLMSTRNRAPILRKVLTSYISLQKPSQGWKLVVVDNGSTDETSEVLASFKERLPLEILSESNLGKNIALNAGLSCVEGDLAVFTDDDVFPYADWLVRIREIANAQPQFAIFGGAILPRWEIPPPAWLHWVTDPASDRAQFSDVRAGPVFTLTELSLEDGPISPNLVFGPNMVVRSCIFQSGARFNPNIGPRGSSYPMGSETELILRLHRQGHKAWYVKSAVVEHFIRKEQLDKAWVLQRAIRFGRGQYRISPNPRQLLGVPRYLVRDVPKEIFKIAAATVLFNPKAVFRAHWRLNYMLGQGAEAIAVAREHRNQAAYSI